MLDDITLISGEGPVYYSFDVYNHAQITTIFNPGSWVCEPFYYVYDTEDELVLIVPPNCNPIISCGQLYASIPMTGGVDGYVFNYDGLTISGATIGVEDGPTVLSGADGYFLLPGVNSGEQTIYCYRDGYNIDADLVNVVAMDTVYHEFTLTQPNMVINPLYIEETLNPGEYFTTSMNVLNNGNGPLGWAAEIVYPETDQPVQGITMQEVLAMQNLPINQNVPISDGLAPQGTGNQVPGPVVNLGRDVDSQAWVYNAYSSGGLSEGSYTMILNTPGTFTPLGPAASNFIASADFVDDVYYGCIYGGIWITMDAGTGAITTLGSTPDQSGGAYDYTTGNYYGITFSGSLYTIDVATGAGTLVASSQPNIICMACDNDGELYGVDLSSDFFGHINKTTGAWTPIASVGFDCSYAQDMTCDHSTNTIYWAVYNAGTSQAYLVTVDQATGVITYIGAFAGNAETTGFAIPGGGGGGNIGDWLTMDYYEGNVPEFGGVDNIPTHLDASGTEPGQVYTAEIIFTSDPNVGTITVPVTMIILGPELIAPEDLEVELTDPIAGEATLNWTWNGDAFQFFLIKRDGVVIGTTTSTTYVDLLPDYGEYCYTVQAVYDEGQSAPAGPECVEWPNPEIFINPMSLEGWVWVDNQVTVYTTIYNNGIGTLYYEFPDFAETDDLRAYCAASGGCDEYISNVTIGTINNSSGCSGYGDYTSLSTEVSAGETYPITITNGNPIWTADQCGIWVDWNLDEDFTNDGAITVSGSPGVGPYTANITVPDDAEGGPTRMRVRIVYAATPTPCGSSSFGECEDYTLNVTSGFIISVEPSSGIVEAGHNQQIAITYSAEGFDPGTYFEELLVNSNDPDNEEVIINNTMHVYVPAQFAGMVYDMDDDSPIPGVTVTAGPFQAETNELGEYSLYVDEGEYDVVFSKPGYMPLTVADTTALQGVITPIDVGMWDANYAPAFVTATVQDDDTWCLVEWALPAGPYEIIMDDSEADDFFIYAAGGSWNAVKFTPSGYPATVIGGKFYVGDGSFPGPFIGSEFGVAVFDDDGPGGLPGTMLDSTGVTVNNYGWVSLSWLGATIQSGDFYLAMFQPASSAGAAPIGIDTDNPTYFRSYSKFQANPWALSAFQDFMIRAWVSGPEGDAITDAVGTSWKATPKVPANWSDHGMTQSGTIPRILPGYERLDMNFRAVEGLNNRDVTNYRVARYSQFDPNGSPALGDITELATTTDLEYNDYAWAGLDQGWYAYGVKALYTSGLYSDYAISNIVGHLMDFEVTVNVTLSTGLEPSGVEVTLYGLEFPYGTYFGITPASGTIVFEGVWKGHYDLAASKIGYDVYRIDNTFINSDKTFNIVLQEKKYAPSCLVVDPVTLEATWCEPLRTAITEDFESAEFPPAGWQSLTDGEGWFRTNNGSSSSWIIPTWDSYYACSNDDASSTNVGCCDYLITPALDLRDAEGYFLTFNSYYDGAFGQLAFVEYTLDGGATWEVLSQMSPSAAWANISVDLAQFSGANGSSQIWFAFHADDAGAWASGWAVDNPKVEVPAPPASYLDFYVFLDDAFVGTTMETNWNYAPLTYGQTYTASVAARYTSGLSAKDYYTFFCEYLYPPRNLVGVAPDDAAILVWDPPLEGVTGLVLVSEQPRTEFPNAYSEYSPTVRTVAGATVSRDAWDLQLAFANANASGEAGAESDGDFLYTSMWNASGFQKYNLDGSYVGAVSVGSVGQIRDMAYDDQESMHMFGGQGANTVYEWDFATSTQIGTFTAPTAVRAIAYDPDFDGFWANNWSTAITLFDKTGVTLNSFPIGVFGSYYGFAHDEWTDGGPYLWGFSQVDGVTGNTIVQIEIATGQETGFIFDVNPILITGTGIAGGLFTHPNLFSGTVSIGGNSQNDVFFLYELATSGPPGPSGDVPENLLGYNMYRDGDFVFYQDHMGSYTNPEQQTGIEENLQPGIYEYTVTGVYDLSVYGFPGETGESAPEGPAIVTVDYCFDIEFMETWSLGNFDANNWTSDGSNWTVNGQMGNPAPAAEFTWDPIQTDYELALESYPLCAVGMTEGKIWLDFDVMLESFQPTGEEFLHAQVWSWDAQEWMTVASYSNVDGSFGWMSENINIKAYAMDKVFKVRFFATGMNSLDIVSWFVDNIHVYRTCDGVSNLTATNDYENACVILNWDGPIGGNIDEWVHWDDGTNYDAIGTGGAAEFDVAARWEPSQLAEFEGASVTEIAFFPNEAAATYKVRVWVGAGAANMVVDQTVASPLIGQWNYVALTTPVPIDITNELWVGYYINTTTGYPAGCDDGPAIDGYGNMMNFGGWQTLLQINPDLDYNWNIQAHIQTVTGVSMPLAMSQQEMAVPQGAILSVDPDHSSISPVFAGSSNGSRELSGYNIYRSVEGGEYELIDFTIETAYTNCDLENALYCFMVTAIWESETDQCESAYSNEACTILNVGLADPNANPGSFSLYPNPADNHVFITTSGDLKRVTVYNALGQLVVDEIVTGKQYELTTSNYTIGVYMVRVETAAGVTTRTLTIQR